MVSVCALPVHGDPPFAFVNVGVTVMVLTTGELPVFVAVNAGILPFPDAANPMLVFELVQE